MTDHWTLFCRKRGRLATTSCGESNPWPRTSRTWHRQATTSTPSKPEEIYGRYLFIKWVIPGLFFIYFVSFKEIFYNKNCIVSVGFEMGSSGFQASTLTTWPPTTKYLLFHKSHPSDCYVIYYIIHYFNLPNRKYQSICWLVRLSFLILSSVVVQKPSLGYDSRRRRLLKSSNQSRTKFLLECKKAVSSIYVMQAIQETFNSSVSSRQI